MPEQHDDLIDLGAASQETKGLPLGKWEDFVHETQMDEA